MAKGRNKKSESIIVIDNDWAIKPDAHQWQLCKAVNVKGERIWQAQKYGSLTYLITLMVDMKVRSSAFTTLTELAINISDIKEEMEELLVKNGINV